MTPDGDTAAGGADRAAGADGAAGSPPTTDPVAAYEPTTYPLLEDDLAHGGVLEPSMLFRPQDDVPDAVVLAFFPQTVEAIGALPDTSDEIVFRGMLSQRPLYVREHAGVRVGLCYPSIGAPRAVMFLEEALAMGCRTVIAVGSAGVLVPELVMGHPFVVTSALRDEGTSAHYAPTDQPVLDADPVAVQAIQETLTAAGLPFAQGRTWTTDGIYRETRSRVDRRIAQGCLTVEMEASALIAVARYRGARLGQLLFSADSLADEDWDARGWHRAGDAHEAMVWLAMDAAARLARS